MKSLLALLALGIILGIGFWKTENPDTPFSDLPVSAIRGVDNVKASLQSFTGGGDTIDQTIQTVSLDSDNAVSDGAVSDTIDTAADSLEASADAIDASMADAQPSPIIDAEASQTIDMLETNASKLDASAAKVASIESQLALLNRRIDEQSEEFNAESINSSIEELAAFIPEIQEEQMRAQSEQAALLADINDRLDLFDARISTLSSTATGDESGSINGLSAQVDQRIDMLEDKLTSAGSDAIKLDTLTSELFTSQERIDSLASTVKESQSQISELNRTIGVLKTRSDSTSIDDEQTKLRVQLANLQQQINSGGTDADVEEINDALQSSRERIESLEEQVIDLPASSSEATDATQAQSALQSQITALEEKLANLDTSSDSQLATTISQVQARVSALAAKGFVTQEDLRSQQQGKATEYKIYFEPNSTAITSDAARVLNSFIAQEKNRTIAVSIYGFTDRSGSASYNQQLALQRATNVRSYLVQNGFSYTKIKSVSGLGEDAAAIDLADGKEDAAQRTVVLYAQQP